MRVLSLISDTDGCFFYRVELPFRELKRFGVKADYFCFLPSDPRMDQFNHILNMINNYDLVIIQRCYIYSIVHIVVRACEFLGIPCIFSTDDSYTDLIPSNPAYWAICDNQDLFRRFYEFSRAGQKEEADKLLPDLIASRARGLEGYKQILKEVDWVEVSTEELKRSVYPYNKNVAVFQNNIERVFPWRDSINLQSCIRPAGENRVEVNIPNVLGLYTIPSYNQPAGGGIEYLPRIGYSSTPSHASEDWSTIKDSLNRFHTNHNGNHLIVLFDDSNRPAFTPALENKDGVFTIFPCQYEKYLFNLRNFDIALCPLFPTIFNMSKSDIKLVEAGAWGTAGLAPRFITYSRNWVEEETCLMYSNQEEFYYQLERLVKDHALRNRIGQNAITYVKENRLEYQHSEKRYNFYKQVIESKKRLDFFKPNKEKMNVN